MQGNKLPAILFNTLAVLAGILFRHGREDIAGRHSIDTNIEAFLSTIERRTAGHGLHSGFGGAI